MAVPHLTVNPNPTLILTQRDPDYHQNLTPFLPWPRATFPPNFVNIGYLL